MKRTSANFYIETLPSFFSLVTGLVGGIGTTSSSTKIKIYQSECLINSTLINPKKGKSLRVYLLLSK